MKRGSIYARAIAAGALVTLLVLVGYIATQAMADVVVKATPQVGGIPTPTTAVVVGEGK